MCRQCHASLSAAYVPPGSPLTPIFVPPTGRCYALTCMGLCRLTPQPPVLSIRFLLCCLHLVISGSTVLKSLVESLPDALQRPHVPPQPPHPGPCVPCVAPCSRAPPASLFAPAPNTSCPVYLTGRLEMAGLGHTFMAFNHLLLLAVRQGLTLRARYSTRSKMHPDMRNTTEYFFGDQLFPAVPRPCVTIDVFVATKTLFSEHVHAAIAERKRLCARKRPPGCVILRVGPVTPAKLPIDVALYRRLFQSQALVRQRVLQWLRASATSVRPAAEAPTKVVLLLRPLCVASSPPPLLLCKCAWNPRGCIEG